MPLKRQTIIAAVLSVMVSARIPMKSVDPSRVGPKPCNTCPEWNTAYWAARLALEMFGKDKIPSKPMWFDNLPEVWFDSAFKETR